MSHTNPPDVICFNLTIRAKGQRTNRAELLGAYTTRLFQVPLQCDLKADLLCSTEMGEVRAHCNEEKISGFKKMFQTTHHTQLSLLIYNQKQDLDIE